ncbi:hypothetical protein DL96DRAFT_1520136 [Flagelloscypha sp. PMI_526]|nr:hypothetical protein DL96DRAFT_1520136 [Flagelloscypha sp. PMI_526]
MAGIRAIDKTSIHRITSGQVVIDLQTCVKELVENSLDAGATNIEVKFKEYGIKSIEVVDNGSGIPEEDHSHIAMKHYTSKLSKFAELTEIGSFGFRGEALSSLCALAEEVTVTTSTAPPSGVSLKLDFHGRVSNTTRTARQRGTTVCVTNLFSALPVRRKDLEKNHKREYGKALTLLNAYAIGPCSGLTEAGNPVRLIVSNQTSKGNKTVQIRTSGSPSIRTTISALFGSSSIANLVDLDLNFTIERDKLAAKRVSSSSDDTPIPVRVRGIISKFSLGCGRASSDRQFFYVNGRPCNMPKVAKIFNEVYRTFNIQQMPFVVADFVLPKDTCDINVTPDKRTVFIHSEENMLAALKTCLEETFSHYRSTLPVIAQPEPSQTLRGLVAQTSAPPPVERSEESQERVGGPDATLQPFTASGRTIANTPLSRRRSKSDASDSDSGEEIPPLPTKTASIRESTQHILTIPRPASPEERENGPSRDITKTPSKAASVNPNSLPHTSLSSPTTITGIVDAPATHTASPLRPRPETSEPDIVMDSTQASWSPLKRSSNNPEQNPSTLPRKRSYQEENDDMEAEPHREALPQLKRPRQSTGVSDAPRPELPVRSSVSWNNRISSFAQGSWRPHDPPSADAHPTRQLTLTQITALSSRQKSSKGQENQTDGSSEITASLSGDSIEPTPLIKTELSDEPPLSELPVEIVRTIVSSDASEIVLEIDLPRINDAWTNTAPSHKAPVSEKPHSSSENAGIDHVENNSAVATALSRIIEQADFRAMGQGVVGQFNLGFIIARRKKVEEVNGEMDDLFIIDQHAADEKYNFETLQQTTVLEGQKLLRPEALELTATDELLAMENLDVLKQNGFDVVVDESEDSRAGLRLRLVSHPVSKTTVFTVQDLEEIIHLLSDRVPGQVIRPSKVRAMFASRACRKSVMIGTPLSKKQMTSIVQHMGTMVQPWNCPHGRPTMRHLADLRTVSEKRVRKVNWGNLLGSRDEGI